MCKVEGLKPQRCVKCGSRLFDAYIINGIVEIKCKCGTINTIKADSPVKVEPVS